MKLLWTSRESLMKWFLATHVPLREFLSLYAASDTGKPAAYALLSDIFLHDGKVDEPFIREIEVVIMLD